MSSTEESSSDELEATECKKSKIDCVLLVDQLHNKLGSDLQDRFVGDDFKNFKYGMNPYLQASAIDNCEDVLQLFQKLTRAKRIEPGKYSVIISVLQRMERNDLADKAKRRGKKIAKLLKKKSAANVVVVEAKPEHRSADGQNTDGRWPKEIKAVSDRCRKYCDGLTRLFVKTSTYHRARTLIEKENSLLLRGGFGEGKSYILNFVTAHDLQGYHPVHCNSPLEIQERIQQVEGTDMKLAFMVDGPFGWSYLDQCLLDAWVSHGKNLEMYLHVHKFVFATRTSIWNACKVHIRNSHFFSNVVDVKSGDLTADDKRNLLKTYSDGWSKLTEGNVKEIVDSIEHISFCQCCKLMNDAALRGKSGQDLVEIFRRPYSYGYEELSAMRQSQNVQYATVCLVMLCGGRLECEQLSGSDLSDVRDDVGDRIKTVLNTCGCAEKSIGNLQQAAENLDGSYLETVDDSIKVFKFSHDSIHEAVILEYGRRHFGECLKYLDSSTIVKMVREFGVSISESHYEKVVTIFISTVISQRSGLKEVFQNPCMKDEGFQSVMCDHLKLSPNKLAVFGHRKHGQLDRCILYYAAHCGSLKLLQFLFDYAKVTCTCRGAFSPLRGATAGGQPHVIKYLLATYPPTDEQIREAVKSACKFGNKEALKILSPMLGDDTDQTREKCLWIACWYEQKQIMKYLLDNYYSKCGSGACDCGKGVFESSWELGHKVIVSVLLNHGADLNSSGHKGNTALHKAARLGDKDTVAYLIDRGLGVDTRNKNQISPLHMSAYRQQPEALKILLENKADVNVKDKWGLTSLHAALMQHIYHSRELERRRNVVEALLRGENLKRTIKDKWNRTVLGLAVQKGLSDIAKMLVDHGYETNSDAIGIPDEKETDDIFRSYEC